MTEEKKVSTPFTPIAGLAIIFLLFCPSFLFPEEISEGVLSGIKLCVFNVVPSIFPFFIIADAAAALSGSLGESFLGRVFEKIFRLPRQSVSAYLLGNICGFPIGVTCASGLYKSGAISKKDAEQLIGFSNNPSFAFVTTAVGLGMFGSFKLGLLLYFNVLFSSLIVGFLFRKKDAKILKNKVILKQKFDFVASVKNAGLSSVTVSSYIIFFSALSGLLVYILGDGLIGAFFVMVCEVSGASSFISSNPLFTGALAFVLTALSLTFSGFSVHLQARSIAAPELSFCKYYLMKISAVLICVPISLGVYHLVF